MIFTFPQTSMSELSFSEHHLLTVVPPAGAKHRESVPADHPAAEAFDGKNMEGPRTEERVEAMIQYRFALLLGLLSGDRNPYAADSADRDLVGATFVDLHYLSAVATPRQKEAIEDAVAMLGMLDRSKTRHVPGFAAATERGSGQQEAA